MYGVQRGVHTSPPSGTFTPDKLVSLSQNEFDNLFFDTLKEYKGRSLDLVDHLNSVSHYEDCLIGLQDISPQALTKELTYATIR